MEPTFSSFQDKTIDNLRDQILETRGKIGDANEHDIELWGKIQEELAHQDEGIKH